MKQNYLLLIFLIIFSCSTLEHVKDSNTRSPNSLAKVFNSCRGGILNLFTSMSEKKVISTLKKIEAGEVITESDRLRLSNLTFMIPFENEKKAIEEALRSKSVFDPTEILTIKNFIAKNFLLKHNTDSSLYKKMYFGGDENFPLSFGVEFELILDEVPAILNSYRVKHLSEEQWYSLALEERVKIAKQTQMNADDVDDVDNLFIKLSSANPKLPDGLFVEPHGTIEGNDLVFDNLGDLHDLLGFMSEKFGLFSWQSHVVFDANPNFKGMSGYSIFEFEQNQLSVLENGFERYLKNDKAIPSANIVNSSLGPMDEKMAKKLREADEYLENGLMDITVDGVKSMSAPHFRVNGPYGPGKMGFELRQFHKRYDAMFDSLSKLANDLQNFGSLEHYSEFSKAAQISEQTIENALRSYGYSGEKIENFQLFLSH